MKGGILYKGCFCRCQEETATHADEDTVLESINLSAYLSARNRLPVNTLYPLADRLTDISRFKKLRYIFLVRNWSFKRFRIPRVEGTGFKGFGAPCTLFFQEKKEKGSRFVAFFQKNMYLCGINQ